MALDDRDPYAHWALGFVNLFLRRHDVAISEAERAIALTPNLAEAHDSLGNALHFSGRSEEALAYFDRAMAFNPYLSGHFPALPGTSDVSVGQIRKGNRHPETTTGSQPRHRHLTRTPGGELRPPGPLRQRRASSGRRFSASTPTILWNIVARCCLTRTLPISSLSWKGFARLAWCNFQLR